VATSGWSLSMTPLTPSMWRRFYNTNLFFDPNIRTQPQSQSVSVGQPVTFTTAANGSSQPRFQWKKNGSNISGATASSYNIASAVSGDAALYSVFVEDQAGNVTSANATLNVGGVLGGGPYTKTYGGKTRGSGTR
jgi:hypothetical protein